ncbi:hypothetical protein LSH36_69g01002 [Paralvinella palmiformis]|uniref:Uncharacterized protein n=1 Tax=Paralvinella palmiformis TaxID=53620 RepID=A0AAD9NDB0_9ANNE|nr:hypothetical protein LSH36_69g01002 [Paralvinella palmiformis]
MGRGKDGACPGVFFSILWFFGIFVIAYPVSGLFCSIYLFLAPFAACIPPLKGALKVILGLINYPYTFSKNMVNMAACDAQSWAPDNEV